MYYLDNNFNNLIYLFIFGALIIVSLLDALFLNWNIKKINPSTSYWKTLKISLLIKVFIFLIVFIAPFIFNWEFNPGRLAGLFLFSFFICFFIFKKLLNRYYGISFKKIISLYITYALLLLIIINSVLVVRFFTEIYISIAKPSKVLNFCGQFRGVFCEPSLICKYQLHDNSFVDEDLSRSILERGEGGDCIIR